MERALGPGSLLPPRLEDAGLEDCALPPESIKEAFVKAAAAAGSRAASIFGTSADESDEEEGCCLNDPNPNNKQPSDVLVGISDVDPPPGACGGNKGSGVPEVKGDEVAAGMSDAKGMTDKVVDGGVLPTGGREGCQPSPDCFSFQQTVTVAAIPANQPPTPPASAIRLHRQVKLKLGMAGFGSDLDLGNLKI